MKKTISVIIALLILAGLISGCAFGTITKGNGNITSREIAVKDFNSVSLSGSVDVNISLADSYSVIVTADSNVQKHVEATVNNGVLDIGEKSVAGIVSSFSPTKFVVDITMPEIQALELSGNGTMTLSGGSGESINILLSGDGDIHAREYQTKNATVELTGNGSIEMWATDSLNGELTGDGDLLYKGTPEVNVDSTGNGDVRKISD